MVGFEDIASKIVKDGTQYIAKEVATDVAKTAATQVAKETAKTIAQTTFKDAFTIAAEKAAANTAAATVKAGAQSVATTAAATTVQAGAQTLATNAVAATTTSALQNTATTAATTAAKSGFGATLKSWAGKAAIVLGKGTLWGINHPFKTITATTTVAALTQLTDENNLLNKAGDVVLDTEADIAKAVAIAAVGKTVEIATGAPAKPTQNSTLPSQNNGSTPPKKDFIAGLIEKLPEPVQGIATSLAQSGWGKALLGLVTFSKGGALLGGLASAGGLGMLAPLAGPIAAIIGIAMIIPAVINFVKGDSSSNQFDLNSLIPPTTHTQQKTVEAPAKGKGLEQDIPPIKPITLGKLPEGGKVVTQVDHNATLPAPTIGGGPSHGLKK